MMIPVRSPMRWRVFSPAADPLTGLPNREPVLAHLRTALARLARSGAPVAVLFLDLDRFKPVNDRYGHAAGDRILVQVANRLHHQMRATDIVGRVGGDEFLVVCDSGETAALVDRLRHAVSSPIQLGADSVSVGASIGVAVASVPVGADLDGAAGALVARADAAMYEEKRRRAATASRREGARCAPHPPRPRSRTGRERARGSAGPIPTPIGSARSGVAPPVPRS